MDSPADGDELARVVPLRRRDRELTAAPGARGTLPRERAPFDPEIEPFDTPSGNAARKGWRSTPPTLGTSPATSTGASGRQTLQTARDGTRPRCS